MKDVLFLLICGLILYIISRIILKEPILPWKDKKPKEQLPQFKTKQKKTHSESDDVLEEEPVAPFEHLFPEIKSLDNHMIRRYDNTFTMVAEVEPVNYFLLDQSEQESIDSIFETWLAQINYPVRIYLQNRFIDLSEQIEEIQKIMNEEDLSLLAYEYGQKMIEDLIQWQRSQPRYETKRYLVFDYKVDVKDIKAENAEELEEKIIDKAFNELYRRVMTAKTQLRKANIEVNLLTTDGICEVLYYTFNRRKALKNRYKDIEEQEQLALYVTADQSASRIAKVKEEIETVQEVDTIQEEAI